ncbi:MAG: DUF502 domain-containing protein [Caldimonas sp.]
MKRYLIAGLLVWLPLAVTIWVLQAVLGLLDGVFNWLLSGSLVVLPLRAHASIEYLRSLTGLGVIVTLLGLLVTGVFATNIVGQWWLRQGHRLLNKIPIVKSIYSSVKQVSDTLFSSSGNAFRQAVLVEYPRHGSWTIAFVTGKPGGEAGHHLHGDYLSIYVPTTPNPTSGFFLMVPRAEVITLAMSVDEALKYVISMGVVAPPMHAASTPTGARPARLGAPLAAESDAMPSASAEAARNPTG